MKIKHHKTKVIILTGSIGSGKSTALNLFKNKGFDIFDSDQVAKKLMLNLSVQKKILHIINLNTNNNTNNYSDSSNQGSVKLSLHQKIEAFIFNANHQLIIENLQAIENIIHPLVQKEQKIAIKKAKTNGKSIVIESAIFFKIQNDLPYDIAIAILSHKKSQTQRISTRNGKTLTDNKKLLEILSLHNTNQEFKNLADIIVRNNSSQEKFLLKIIKIIDNLI